MIGYKDSKNKFQDGFTLVEMLVVIGIFSVVLIIIVGMVTRFTSLQRVSIAEQSLQSDLRFAMELFNREVRTGFGSTFQSIRDKNIVVFRNQNSNCVQYRFQDSGIERAEVANAELRPNQNCANANYDNFSKLTKNQTRINIQESGFFPYRGEDNDNGLLISQGFIMVKIAADSQSVPPINLQSTVTSRQVVTFDSLAGESN